MDEEKECVDFDNEVYVKNFISESLECGDQDSMEKLVRILKNTGSARIRHIIAICIADMAIAEKEVDFTKIFSGLVEVISRPELFNCSGTITYACSELGDFSDYFLFFAKLVIEAQYATSWMALDVVYNMNGPFKKNELAEISQNLNKSTRLEDGYGELFDGLRKFIENAMSQSF